MDQRDGIREEAFSQTAVAGHRQRTWSNRKGDPVIELYLIDGMGHGTPVRRTKVHAAAGGAGPFMLDVGISSSLHLAKSWGLVGTEGSLPQDLSAGPRPDPPC